MQNNRWRSCTTSGYVHVSPQRRIKRTSYRIDQQIEIFCLLHLPARSVKRVGASQLRVCGPLLVVSIIYRFVPIYCHMLGFVRDLQTGFRLDDWIY
jgi:hypothetical protein